ncbi:MAG: hypothetical protein D6800_13245 [Candidatus Zixiibacteriota bacterium]|nr:MAG: hypothetical protein D6800_13245 [candidate division Zixibacteria bacterium]
MQVLQERLDDFKAAGATLVAISSETPDNSLTTVEKHQLKFEVLTDPDNNLARQFGIVYEVTGDLAGFYKKLGVDLKALHHSDKAELPLAATYVIDTTGTIRYAFLDVDYTRRAEPDELLRVLKSI